MFRMFFQKSGATGEPGAGYECSMRIPSVFKPRSSRKHVCGPGRGAKHALQLIQIFQARVVCRARLQPPDHYGRPDISVAECTTISTPISSGPDIEGASASVGIHHSQHIVAFRHLSQSQPNSRNHVEMDSCRQVPVKMMFGVGPDGLLDGLCSGIDETWNRCRTWSASCWQNQRV